MMLRVNCLSVSYTYRNMKSIQLIFLFIVHIVSAVALREEFKYTEVDLKGSCPIIKYVNNLSMSRIVGWYSQAFSSANNSLCFNSEGQTVKVASFDNRTLSVQYCYRSPTDPDVADCGNKSGTSSLDKFFFKTGIDENDLYVLYTNYNDLTIAYGCRPSCSVSGLDEFILILSNDYTLSLALEARARTVLENNGIKFSNAKIVKQCRTKGIEEASTDEEIIACYPVITELYPHIQCKDELVTRVKLQNEMGYRLLYITDKETNRVASICGFRITNSLLTGKTLYLEDLCTLPFARCRGNGRALIDRAKELAKDENCDAVTLNSAYTRNTAHRLLLNSGFDLGGHHFVMKLR